MAANTFTVRLSPSIFSSSVDGDGLAFSGPLWLGGGGHRGRRVLILHEEAGKERYRRKDDGGEVSIVVGLHRRVLNGRGPCRRVVRRQLRERVPNARAASVGQHGREDRDAERGATCRFVLNSDDARPSRAGVIVENVAAWSGMK